MMGFHQRRRTGVGRSAKLCPPEDDEDQQRYAGLRQDHHLCLRVVGVGHVVGHELRHPARQREQELAEPHDELPTQGGAAG